MRRQILVSIATALLLVAGVALSSFAQTTPEGGSGDGTASFASQFAFKTNSRAARTEPLKESAALNEAARETAEKIAGLGGADQAALDGIVSSLLGDGVRFKATSYRDSSAINQAQLNLNAAQALADSEDGDAKWKHIGSGYAKAADGSWHVCRILAESEPPDENPSQQKPPEDAGSNFVWPAEKLLEKVNEERSKEADAHSLRTSPGLAASADVRAREMAESGIFEHYRPDGSIFDTAISAIGEVGENIYRVKNYEGLTPEEIAVGAFDWWMDSDAHRGNMTDTKFLYMGSGAALSQDGYWYVCQLFSSSPSEGDPPEDDSGHKNLTPGAGGSGGSSGSGNRKSSAEILDPNALIQKLESPQQVVAGDVLEVRATLNPSASINSWQWGCYPSRYHGSNTWESKDKKSFYVKAQAGDPIQVSLEVTTRDGRRDRQTRTVEVANSLAASISGPETVKPGVYADYDLVVDEAAGKDNIKWSVEPGLCVLRFSNNKRHLQLLTPYNGQVRLTAKIELNGESAVVRKTFRVVTTIPLKLEAPASAEVGKQMEIKAVFDGEIEPRNFYWGMSPGTCKARFSADKSVMYFTPETTDTLTVDLRIKRGSDYGTDTIIIPVRKAGSGSTGGNKVTVAAGSNPGSQNPASSGSNQTAPSAVGNKVTVAAGSNPGTQQNQTSGGAGQNAPSTDGNKVTAAAGSNPGSQLPNSGGAGQAPPATSAGNKVTVASGTNPGSQSPNAGSASPALPPANPVNKVTVASGTNPGSKNPEETAGGQQTSSPATQGVSSAGSASQPQTPSGSAGTESRPGETAGSSPTSAAGTGRPAAVRAGTSTSSGTFKPGTPTQTLTSGPVTIERPGAGSQTGQSGTLELRDASIPEIRTASGSGLSIKTAGDSGPLLCGVSMEAGEKASQIADVISGLEVGDGMRLQVIGSDGRTASPDDAASTGQTVRVYDRSGKLAGEVTIVVPGDVLGTGRMSIAQLTRVARALAGTEPLTGPFLQAAKMTAEGVLPGPVSISDLARLSKAL